MDPARQKRKEEISKSLTFIQWDTFFFCLKAESETYPGTEWLISLITELSVFLSDFTSCVLGLPLLIQILRAIRYQLLLQIRCYATMCLLTAALLLSRRYDLQPLGHKLFLCCFSLKLFLPSYRSFLAACKVNDWPFFAFCLLGSVLMLSCWLLWPSLLSTQAPEWSPL